MDQMKIIVKGMTCNHCKSNVEKTIKAMQHVSEATVDLDKSLLVVNGDNVDLDEVKKRVEDIGYEYGGVLD
jgi:copper chaperone CopZ